MTEKYVTTVLGVPFSLGNFLFHRIFRKLLELFIRMLVFWVNVACQRLTSLQWLQLRWTFTPAVIVKLFPSPFQGFTKIDKMVAVYIFFLIFFGMKFRQVIYFAITYIVRHLKVLRATSADNLQQLKDKINRSYIIQIHVLKR